MNFSSIFFAVRYKGLDGAAVMRLFVGVSIAGPCFIGVGKDRNSMLLKTKTKVVSF